MLHLIKSDSLPDKTFTPEMRAVLYIFSSKKELKEKALPHVDIYKEYINWFAIGRSHFSCSQTVAIMWARCIWLSKNPIYDDPFERTYSMEPEMRKIVIEALSIAWGLD